MKSTVATTCAAGFQTLSSTRATLYLFSTTSHMDEQTARRTARHADGWMDWDNIRNCPSWVGGEIILDGRFSAEELRAILQFEGKGE